MSSDAIDVDLVLIAISGTAWTIVYISAIWVGFRHRTYAMPLLALALNLAWESTYAPLDLMTAFSGDVVISELAAQGVISIVWALADMIIVYTFFRFGRAEFPPLLNTRMFVSGAILVFASAYAVQWLFVTQFGADAGSRYSAFLQNLLMSGLFIAMFFARRGPRGQTLTIAVGKWLGTLAATILYGPIEGSTFILGVGVLCCAFDLVYIGLIARVRRRPDALAADAAPVTPAAVAA
jgi:hypothetical protein